MQSWKQYALPVIATMALWHLMHLGTRYMVFTSLNVERLTIELCVGNKLTGKDVILKQ